MFEAELLLSRNLETALLAGESSFDVARVKLSPEDLVKIKGKDVSVIKILANTVKKPLAVKHFTVESAIESAEALLENVRARAIGGSLYESDRECLAEAEYAQWRRALDEQKAKQEAEIRAKYEHAAVATLIEQEKLPVEKQRCLHEAYSSLLQLEKSYPGFQARYEAHNKRVRLHIEARNELRQIWGQAIELGLLAQNNDMAPGTSLRRQFDQNLMPDDLLLEAFAAFLQPVVGEVYPGSDTHERVRISERRLYRRSRMSREQFIEFEDLQNKVAKLNTFPLTFAIREFVDQISAEQGFASLVLQSEVEINLTAKEDKSDRLIYVFTLDFKVSSEYFGPDHKASRTWSVFYGSLVKNESEEAENDDD